MMSVAEWFRNISLFSITSLCLCSLNAAAMSTESGDFDLDSLADPALYNGSDISLLLSSNHYVNSSPGVKKLPFGIPFATDFDGDGFADIAIKTSESWLYRLSSSTPILESSQSNQQQLVFGLMPEDIPFTGDFDGDGKDDFAFVRPSEDTWFIRNYSGSTVDGSGEDGIQRIVLNMSSSDIPVPGDYDGDGITDIAFYRASSSDWFIRYSSANSAETHEVQRVRFLGNWSDIPVPADYDGDGITDIAVRKPATFRWLIRLSGSNGKTESIRFGSNRSDISMVADYDGDGKADLALYNPRNGLISIRQSSDRRTLRLRSQISGAIPVNAPLMIRREFVAANQLDTDGDGLGDYAEQNIYFTDPNNPDSDADGLTDFEEVNQFNTRPNLADSDNDGLSDYAEIMMHYTDPRNSDTDGDGIDDGLEVRNGTNPGRSTTFPLDSLLSGYVYMGYGDQLRSGYTVSKAHLEWAFVLDSRYPVYKFNTDQTGWISSPENTFEWKVNESDGLTLSHFSDSTTYTLTDFTDPTAALDIFSLDSIFDVRSSENSSQQISDILFGIDFQNATSGWHYQKCVKEIQIAPSAQVGNELHIIFSPVYEHRMSIPVEYRQHFSGHSELFGIEQNIVGASRTLLFASERDKIEISASEMEGDWIVPHLYEASPSELNSQGLAQSQDKKLNKVDRLTFSPHGARGQFSGYQYLWRLSQEVLSLTRAENRYEIRPFDKVGQHYQAEIRYFESDTLKRVYIGRLVKANESAQSFINNPHLRLPNVYMWSHWHRDILDEQGLFSLISGYSFNTDSSVNYGIGTRYSFDNQSYYFESFLDTTFTVDAVDNSLIISNPEGPDFIWQVLDVDASGKVTVLTLNRVTEDSNGNGRIDNDEVEQSNFHSVDEYVVDYLSRYGDTYENSKFNFTTTQTVTMELNLPANDVAKDADDFNPLNTNSYNASTEIEIYDSLGNPHTQVFYFLKDANAQGGNDWLVVTSIDGVFYDFANAGGSIPPLSTIGNSPADNNPGINLLGYGQSINVDNGSGTTTTRLNGVWAARLQFATTGDLTNVQIADGTSITALAGDSITIPTTIPLTGMSGVGADETQMIGLELNFDANTMAASESTQLASPFSIITIEQDGRPRQIQ